MNRYSVVVRGSYPAGNEGHIDLTVYAEDRLHAAFEAGRRMRSIATQLKVGAVEVRELVGCAGF